MAGVGGDDGPADHEPGRVREVLLADDFAQLFDDSGEHAVRLTSADDQFDHHSTTGSPCTSSAAPTTMQSADLLG